MAKLSSKGLIVVALVLSLVTSVLVYSYLKGVATKAIKPGLPVVVAKVDIPAKTKVTADMVMAIDVPAEFIQPGAMNDVPIVVGVMTRERIMAGEQVTQRRLAIDGKPVGFTGIIPSDRRAITVAVTEVTGVAGFIKAGDYVDIVHMFDTKDIPAPTTRTMLQNILVLAVDRETEAGINESGAKDKKEAVKTMTVTLAVTPDEAAQVTLAEEKGKIRLTLRPQAPNPAIVETNSSTPWMQVGVHPSPAGDSAPSGGSSSAPPVRSSSGVQTIRGTKVENVPVN